MNMKVALAQIPVVGSIAENLAAVSRAIQYAAGEKADILLTPEGSLSGYTAGFDRMQLVDALAEVTAAARRNHLGLALGTCADEGGQCYDMLRFYLPDGSFLGSYAKILLCGTADDPPAGEINDYATWPLRVFDYQGVTIGGLICNDMWANPGCTPMANPFLARQLKKMGANIIFHAVNGGRDGSDFSQRIVRNFHESNVLMIAKSNQIAIVTVDNAAPFDIGVSSAGGVAAGADDWAMRLPVRGEQFGSFVLEIN
jgi:predicted amidohydrolase